MEKPMSDKKSSHRLTGNLVKPPEASLERAGVAELVDQYFLAYNAGRLREACRLFVEKMLSEDVTVGLGLSGALTPAGLGASCLVPMIESGWIDWISTTGANVYHDLHHGLGLPVALAGSNADDAHLRREGLVRIYDLVLDHDTLTATDAFLRAVLAGAEYQRTISSAELHYRLGGHIADEEERRGRRGSTFLGAAHRCDVPVYAPSPGDSGIGMNIAALALRQECRLAVDVSLDVNETAAIVLRAKRAGKSGVLILGGGAPKNFLLQTEPHIQEIYGIEESGHDFFIQFTDARPDSGGLSGATPSEAVSWGKVAPEAIPDTAVAYGDTTILLPILAAYAAHKGGRRPLKRLYHRRDEFIEALRQEINAR